MRDEIKKRLWPTLIVAALLGNVVLGAVLIRVANSDPSFAVEPDYYRKAVGWDSVQAQAESNMGLGWQAIVDLSGIKLGQTETVRIRLIDRDGVPVTKAMVNVDAMPVAFANRVSSGVLSESVDPGSYSGGVVVDRPGMWELRLVATRDGDRFTQTIRLEAFRDSAAQVVTVARGEADLERLEAGMREAP